MSEMYVITKASDLMEVVIGVPCHGEVYDVYVGITHSSEMYDYTLRVESFGDPIVLTAKDKGGCVEFPECTVVVEENETVILNVSVDKKRYMISVKSE